MLYFVQLVVSRILTYKSERKESAVDHIAAMSCIIFMLDIMPIEILFLSVK